MGFISNCRLLHFYLAIYFLLHVVICFYFLFNFIELLHSSSHFILLPYLVFFLATQFCFILLSSFLLELFPPHQAIVPIYLKCCKGVVFLQDSIRSSRHRFLKTVWRDVLFSSKFVFRFLLMTTVWSTSTDSAKQPNRLVELKNYQLFFHICSQMKFNRFIT